MTNRISVFLYCLILLTAVSPLFAGGGAEEAPVIEIAHNATNEEQILVFETVFQDMVDRYNAENEADYVLNFVTGQGKDIINTRMSSNDRPDIFSLDSPADANQYAGDGLLLDITDYAGGWENVMFDWAYDLAKVNGRVVTLPYGYEGMVIWHNNRLMTELGLNAADIDTLAEFEDALEAAANAGYIPIMLGSQDWPWAQEWYLSILYSYTGRQRVKDIIEGNGQWTESDFADTVALYKSWHDKGYLADGKSYVLTSADAINAFSTDKALFKLEGTWAPYWILPLEEADREKIGVMLHPAINTVERPHLPLAVGGMWCISADTEHADIAAYILNGLLAQDIQGDFLRAGMDVAPIQVESSQFQGLLPLVEGMWEMINGALADGSFGYTTWAFYPPETRVYLYEGIVNVLENNITIDEYLAEMQRLTNKELAQGFNPVIPTAQ